MLGLLITLAAQVALPASAPAVTPASAPVNVRANDLFDRDAMLKAWAVRLYDSNRDGWLTLYEANGALVAFKDLADGNRDGRVTTYEYDRAKEFIAAR